MSLYNRQEVAYRFRPGDVGSETAGGVPVSEIWQEPWLPMQQQSQHNIQRGPEHPAIPDTNRDLSVRQPGGKRETFIAGLDLPFRTRARFPPPPIRKKKLPHAEQIKILHTPHYCFRCSVPCVVVLVYKFSYQNAAGLSPAGRGRFRRRAGPTQICGRLFQDQKLVQFLSKQTVAGARMA